MNASFPGALPDPAVPVVVAVVVTFNPAADTLEAQLLALRQQVACVILVDNGSRDEVMAVIRALAERQACHLLSLGENVGIGAAQNRGIEAALAQQADYVLLMDHDSVPFDDMVVRLVDADRELRSDGVAVAAVAPTTVDKRNGITGKFVRLEGWSVQRHCGEDSGAFIEADFLIASGTLIRRDVLAHAGLMDESYFIDHVDTEWCFRARHLGGHLFGVDGARLYHELGDSVRRVWLGRWRNVFVHSPMRDYYAFRNTILMIRGTPMPFAWKLHFLYRLCQFVVCFGLGIAPRLRRLKCMGVGLLHGFAGKSGRMPADV